MTDFDEPIDLAPIAADADRRAAAISTRVAKAMYRQAVLRRLARVRLPAALAAAAALAAVWLTAPRRPRPEPFAALIVSAEIPRSWVVLARPTDPRELLDRGAIGR